MIALSLAAVGILRVVFGCTTDSHENMGGGESIVGAKWNCLWLQVGTAMLSAVM